MANIDYSKVGWNTTTVLNPTNFNHMDDALKTVCDKMDNVGDEVLGYEITASAPDHQIINATNATNAIKDGAGNNIANQFSELNNNITSLQSGKVDISQGTTTLLNGFQGMVLRQGNILVVNMSYVPSIDYQSQLQVISVSSTSAYDSVPIHFHGAGVDFTYMIGVNNGYLVIKNDSQSTPKAGWYKGQATIIL